MSVSLPALDIILSDLAKSRSAREELYKEFHRHPELSLQEFETSRRIRSHLDQWGIDNRLIGRTGVVAVISNGKGPVVAMRGDIDGLPMKEVSGKDYASTATQVDEATGQELPVAHSCGHDVHIMSLLGALKAFHDHRDAWSGTFVGVFQPAEEIAAGAQDMVDHDIAAAMPTPDVYLGQHVMATLPAGSVGTLAGPILTAASSIKITLHGVGSHGSMPNLGVDPVVLGAAVVMRLQTIVSREVAALDSAVVTVGSFNAGTKSNIIGDTAVLRVNTRAYSKETEKHLFEAIERIVRAECQASRSPKEPEFEYYDVYPLTDNSLEHTKKVRAAFDARFGAESLDTPQLPASEDFSIIPTSLGVPYVFWVLGGFNDLSTAIGNHNPAFAPDLQPTLDRGVEAIVTAAGAWLAPAEVSAL